MPTWKKSSLTSSTHPDAGSVLTKVPGLGAQGEITADAARERSTLYATKLLKRVLGK